MIRHRCLRYAGFEGDTLNTRFREDRDRQELRILKVHESKLVRQLLVEISEVECWIEIVGGSNARI